MLIFHACVDLDTGFQILSEPKHARLVRGKSVSLPSGARLFEHLRATGSQIRCWSCGIEANCFIANKGRNDKMGPPVLDLFAMKIDGPVLMTRDHIIPKSYGGVNDVANLRVGCGPCNHSRGNELEAGDIEFMRAHPELVRHDGKFKLEDNVTFVAKSSGVKEYTEAEQAERKEKLRVKRRKVHEKKAKKKADKLPKLTSMMVLALA